MAATRSSPARQEPTRAPPARRRLRAFSLDPTLSRRTGASAVMSMPWEPLTPGPVGSRIAVLDFTADGTRIPGVDLDHPYLLATDGLDPDESDPQFHQQMVYAVISSLLETLDNARGRRLVWRNVWRTSAEGPGVRPMPVFPHRARAANAFYAPGEGLSFGSFVTSDDEMLFAGQEVHGCLSHDIVNHEAGHAFLHELRPLSLIPTGPDALAFQEGFADILAILQHFTLPGLLEAQIAQGGAPLWEPGPFVDLAVEFGYGSGKGRSVRTALSDPTPKPALTTSTEPHERGAVLVAALFEAFFAAYSQRIEPVLRVAGIQSSAQARSLPQELVTLLCREARLAASMVLTMAVRAVDYLPTMGITFTAFLDAMIAADSDLFPEDRNGFRRSLVESCRRRGIYPSALPGSMDGDLPDFDRWEPLPTRQALVMATHDLGSASALPTRPIRGAGQLDRAWRTSLLAWGRRNAALLGLDASALEVDGGNASFRVNQDGFPTAVVSARFVQRNPDGSARLDKLLKGVPLVGGTTVIAAGSGRVRYAVHTPVPGVGTAGDALLGRLREEAQPLALDALDCLRVDLPAGPGEPPLARPRVPRPRRAVPPKPPVEVRGGGR